MNADARVIAPVPSLCTFWSVAGVVRDARAW